MRLTSTQRSVLSDFLAEARRRGASPKETKALVEAGLVEANLGNPRYGDRDSLGSLQQRPSQGWGSAAQVLNPRYAASKFLSSAKQANRPGISAGQLAQAVQRSAFPGRYQERSGQAESLLSGRRSGSTTTTTTTPGVDRAPERQALLLSYLDQRSNPDALLDLASGLKANQDTPGSSRTIRRAGTSSGTPKGHVAVAAGANRAGIGIAPETKRFLRSVAGHAQETITVGTGTNHNRLTVDGNVSDHWDGHAADIPVPVDSRQGDLIAAHALVAAGKPWGEALKMARQGGLFTLEHNGHRIQVIWKTNQGGNHHNHVHIGFR